MSATLVKPRTPDRDRRALVPNRPRKRPLRRIDVAIVAIVAIYNGFAASRLLFIDDTTVQPWRWLWPILFAVGAVTSVWFAWCALEVRCNHITAALAWSGASNITAYASRAMILLLGLTRHQSTAATVTTTPTKLQFGVATWMLLAAFTGYVWLHVFRPSVELSKYNTLEE